MATQPVRVKEDTYEELQGASRLLGQTPAELLSRAWRLYKESPEFRDEFELARKAFSVGDLNVIADMLEEQSDRWAERAADDIREMRRR